MLEMNEREVAYQALWDKYDEITHETRELRKEFWISIYNIIGSARKYPTQDTIAQEAYWKMNDLLAKPHYKMEDTSDEGKLIVETYKLEKSVDTKLTILKSQTLHFHKVVEMVRRSVRDSK